MRWAVQEAHRRTARLCVVHALSQRHSGAFQRANPAFVAEERRAADDVLGSAVRQARALAGDVDVHPVLEAGRPSVVLLRRAAAADLVVLGSKGRGGFAGLLLGSTSLQVAMHASCPVVVLRGPCSGAGPASGRIVVGADGSPTSDSALRFAFTWAQRHGRGLTVVRAWGSPAIFVDVPGSAKWDQVEKEEQAALSETLVPWRDRYPEVDVLEKSVLGNAAALLVGRVGDSRAPRGGQPRPRRVRRSPARLGQPRRPAPRPLSRRRGAALTTRLAHVCSAAASSRSMSAVVDRERGD